MFTRGTKCHIILINGKKEKNRVSYGYRLDV